ncbi:MAG: small subunit ribosomal protein S2 [Patiriisocius sp.]|jgi:small subunit ribosomal protein S2
MSTENNESNLIERLFKAGAHFGFSKSRRHPSVVPFIFGSKQGTDIFDLEQTAAAIAEAKQTLAEAGENGKTVLFVGTKEEVSKIVTAGAVAVEMPYVTNRWIGGMLTNFSEIKKRIERLKTLTAERESGELERKYIKKERVVIGREVDKLEFNFGGIKAMDRTPAMLVVVDPRHDDIAVTEANYLNIPVIGIMSSDCDAKKMKTAIMVNDALTTSVELAVTELVEAYAEGKKKYTPPPPRTTRPSRPYDRSRTTGGRTTGPRTTGGRTTGPTSDRR